MEEEGFVWKFREIIGHWGPLKHRDPNYMNSKYNVMVEWESGEITKEPLSIMIKDNPITLALYAKKNPIGGWWLEEIKENCQGWQTTMSS